MGWTQNYECVRWMCPSQCTTCCRTVMALGPNSILVYRSLCRFYLEAIFFSRSLLYRLPKSKLIFGCYRIAETWLLHKKCYWDNHSEGSLSAQASMKLRDLLGHTSPGDTNSGTAWWMQARKQLPSHSPNSVGFAPVCWEMWYRDLWMQHREPAEMVTLTGWMVEQEAVAVVAAEEPLQGDVLMTATGSPSHWRDDCSPWSFSIGQARSTASPRFSLSPLPSCLSILLTNTDGAESEQYNSVWVCSSEIIPTDEWKSTGWSAIYGREQTIHNWNIGSRAHVCHKAWVTMNLHSESFNYWNQGRMG